MAHPTPSPMPPSPMSPSPMPGPDRDADAVRAALRRYLDACRARVDPFVAAHLDWPGTVRLHRSTLGFDLLRAPANVLLAVPALLLHLAVLGLHRAGLRGLARRLAGVPCGFQTDVERALVRRLSAEVLGQPAGRPRVEAMLEDGAFGDLTPERRARLRSALVAAGLEAAIEALLARYAATRRASADLATALTLGIAGAHALGQFTPGSLSAGRALAESVGHHAAVRDFLLGPTLGAWYYGVFPPDVSLATAAGTTALVVLLTAIGAGFAGLVADPIQARLGVHRRRLRRWLDALEHLAGGSPREFRPWDPYVARIADLTDVFRALG